MNAVGGFFGLIIGLIVLAYPFVALARIWLYSKEQVELLRDIRSALQQGST